MARFIRYLMLLSSGHFWGDIHIRMTDGKIAMVKVTQDFKADGIPDPPSNSAGAIQAQVTELVRQLKANPLAM